MSRKHSTTHEHGIVLAGRLKIPSQSQALLWDMDGVLLDTLSLDFEVVNDLLNRFVANPAEISKDAIQRYFAYDPTTFWYKILASISIHLPGSQFDALMAEYDQIRETARPNVHDGVREILSAASKVGLHNVVVSNNPEVAVSAMLANAQLTKHFDKIVGNDIPGLAKKPAPDPYLEAAKQLNVPPSSCVVIEDSLLGAEAGSLAGCFTVGVATGGATVQQLSQSPYVSFCYSSFGEPTKYDDRSGTSCDETNTE